MAAIKYNDLVTEKLRQAYKEKYGASPSLLISALHSKYAEDINALRSRKGASQRDLISDKTLRNFFGDAPPTTMQERYLNYLCVVLLNYASYQEAEREISNLEGQNSTDIWRELYKDYIRMQCGTMKVLDMQQPITLENIYVEVKVSETISRQRQKTIDSLVAELEINITSVPTHPKTYPAQEAIQKYSKLVVLGQPGSGKTTLAKRLAMNFVLAESSIHPIPIYVHLRIIAESVLSEPNLETSIFKEFPSSIPALQSAVQSLLIEGKCLILLDGLDEVPDDNLAKVQQKIISFIKDYSRNQFVITCRDADYDLAVFDSFTTVEIASFTTEQINHFIHNWFQERKEPDLIDKFITELNANLALNDLSKKPLFLAMLCNQYEQHHEIPKNLHALYGDMVEALLRRWDATRQFKRSETYGDVLTRPRKINLLSKIAYDGFLKQKLVWRRSELEEQIRDFMEKLNIDISKIDSHSVLQEMEKNLGILIQQAQNSFVFSHSTIQEFFVARYILDNPDHKILNDAVEKHLHDFKWKQIFLIIAGRLSDSDDFLKHMFEQANELAQNEQIQQMMAWLYEKTKMWGVDSVSWRAFYMAVDQDTVLYFSPQNNPNRQKFYNLAVVLKDYSRFKRKSIRPTDWTKLVSGLAAIHVKLTDTHLSERDTLVNNLIPVGKNAPQLLQAVIKIAKGLELVKLVDKLNELVSQIPLDDSPKEKWQDWAENLRKAMIDYLDIGHDISISKENNELLERYIYCCKLIFDCLQGDSLVSKEVRELITDNMLMPREKINPMVRYYLSE